MWSRSRRLGLETVSKRLVLVSSRTKSSTSRSRLRLGPMRLQSHLSLGAVCLGLGLVGLVSGLGPLRLDETQWPEPLRLEPNVSVQALAVHTVAAVRAILNSMTFVAQTYSFTLFLLFHLLIYHKAELRHVSLLSS